MMAMLGREKEVGRGEWDARGRRCSLRTCERRFWEMGCACGCGCCFG